MECFFFLALFSSTGMDSRSSHWNVRHWICYAGMYNYWNITKNEIQCKKYL